MPHLVCYILLEVNNTIQIVMYYLHGVKYLLHTMAKKNLMTFLEVVGWQRPFPPQPQNLNELQQTGFLANEGCLRIDLNECLGNIAIHPAINSGRLHTQSTQHTFYLLTVFSRMVNRLNHNHPGLYGVPIIMKSRA